MEPEGYELDAEALMLNASEAHTKEGYVWPKTHLTEAREEQASFSGE